MNKDTKTAGDKIPKVFTVSLVREFDQMLLNDEITFSRYVEMLNQFIAPKLAAKDLRIKELESEMEGLIIIHREQTKELENEIERLKSDLKHIAKKLFGKCQ